MESLGHLAYEEGVERSHGVTVFAAGSRVYVNSYGPFRGLRGTIQAVNTIASDLEEPFCFYLIALEGTHIREPIWFEYSEVELIAPSSVAFYERS